MSGSRISSAAGLVKDISTPLDACCLSPASLEHALTAAFERCLGHLRCCRNQRTSASCTISPHASLSSSVTTAAVSSAVTSFRPHRPCRISPSSCPAGRRRGRRESSAGACVGIVPTLATRLRKTYKLRRIHRSKMEVRTRAPAKRVGGHEKGSKVQEVRLVVVCQLAIANLISKAACVAR